MNCVQWFREAYPDVLAFHTPNGEKRDRRTAEKLKRMGVLPGVYDWLIFSLPMDAAIEFKSDSGELSDEQIAFNVKWVALNKSVATVQTLDDFKAACIGLLGDPDVPTIILSDVNVEATPALQKLMDGTTKMPWD